MTAPSNLGVYGYASQLGIGASSPVTNRLDFENENFGIQEQLVNLNGLRGTRAHDVSRIRAGTRVAQGSISLQPTAVEWTYLLPWIFGGTPTGTGTVTYPFSDVLGTQVVAIDRISKVFTYSGVAVDRATISSQEGSPLRLRLDLIGLDESIGNAGTFPSLTLDTTTNPFLFFDLALTIGASQQYFAKDFEITIDNAIDKSRFYNSQTMTAIYAEDRTVTFRTQLAYGAANSLYNAGSDGVAMNATFTYNLEVLSFTAGSLVFPRKAPAIPGKQEIMLPIEGYLMKSGSNLELTTTLKTS